MKQILSGLSCFIFLTAATSALAQGNLTPTNAPAPSMKTLAQIEPRTPMDTGNTPGHSAAIFAINQPGSYYLTTNIVGASGKDGIEIASSNVTLDLNGFSLLGIPASSDGIFILGGCTNILVRNGTVNGWGNYGVHSFGRDVVLDRLAVCANVGGGMRCENRSVIRDCTVNNNGLTGILMGGTSPDSSIIGNICKGNNVSNVVGIAGIDIFTSNNRIEGNYVAVTIGSGPGIGLSNATTNNLVIKNVVRGGGAINYINLNNQIAGPIINNSTPGFITNSNPWANFSF